MLSANAHSEGMNSPRFTVQDLILGVAYFCAATLAIVLTRYDGGVAFLWLATAILLAVLMVRPRRRWAGAFISCSIASILATGLFGFGWALAVPMAAVNMIEAYAGARLFRQFGYSRSPLGSIEWLWQFTLSVGVVGPLAGGIAAAAVLATLGLAPTVTFLHFVTGHALGSLTFVPLVTLVAGGPISSRVRFTRSRGGLEIAGLMALTLGVTLLVFAQRGMPLLFLPMLPLILTTFRLGEAGAAIGIVIVALVGGVLTCAGSGPIMFDASIGERLQYFQFYLAATVLTVLPVSADLRNRARLHRDVRLSEARYRLLADHSSDILLHLAVDGEIRFVSPSIRQLGGHDPAQLIGRNSATLVATEHRDRVREAHRATIVAHGRTCTFDYKAQTKSGELRWFETHSRAIVDEDGAVESVLSIVRDITDRKAREMQLTAEALTDVLTGLPNRRAFDQLVDARMAEEKSEAGHCLALVDIDHFKRVNDAHGHDGGDAVLRSFADLARRLMRKDDCVALIGGEEFAILLPNTTLEQARQICERLREELSAMTTLFAGADIRVTISGGVARLGDGGPDFALRVADAALYRAKHNGRDQLSIAA